MRIPVLALVSVLGLPPCSMVEPRGGTGLLVVENASSVDLSFDLSVAGERLQGCFWVLRGRSSTFELPAGQLSWAYSVSGTQHSGRLQLATGHARMLRCTLGHAGLGGDVARCEPAVPPDAAPPKDAMAALSGEVLGFLTDLSATLEKSDAEALGNVIDAPLDVEWLDGQRHSRRVKSAKHLIEVREQLQLDARALSAAKARGGDPREGEDDCGKNAVDWSKGGPALTCTGREVVVALRPWKACGPNPRVDSWTLRNLGTGWVLARKGVRAPPR